MLHEICLNGIWEFKSDADENWTQVRVPGIYSGVRKYWGGEQWDCFDYPEHWLEKGGRHRREFELPKSMLEQDIRFFCGACAHHSEIIVNGCKMGEWHDGYVPIELSIGPALVAGTNTIEVVVSEQKNDLFDDYATYRRGIWQDSGLRVHPWLSLESDLFVKTSVEDQEIACEIPVRNGTDAEQTFGIRCRVLDDDVVAHEFESASLKLEAGKSMCFDLASAWGDAHLWFPHDPHLYELVVELVRDGQAIDSRRVRFGFREITWRGPHLYINGQELFLRGHGGHYMGDIQGSRAYMETWLGEMKKLGINFMRLHDSPKHKELYEVADELGIMLEAEAVFHFKVPEDEAIWQPHLERLVKAQRNHPSIIMWSVSNELRWRGGGEKPELINYVKRFDKTRPVFASDFSLESRFGDICAHHYDPETVFEDWAEFGPDKPMVWDELGSVWQHDRPLDNGTSGYEVQAQDYATGLWHDGHDQILKDIRIMHDGKEFAGELHRINGYCPWDLAYVFFRWQPFNNNQLLEFDHDSLEGPGIKLKHVRPCSSTVNPWDPTLPAFEPNPGFYLFADYLKAVRFFDDTQARTFFAGETISLTSRLFYEDTRPADELACVVEALDGESLTVRSIALDLSPGQIVDELSLSFELPEVDDVTQVQLVREFRQSGQGGYRDVRQVKLAPRSEFSGRIGVFQSPGLTSGLRKLGLDVVEMKDDLIDCELIVTEAELCEEDEIRRFAADGGRVLCLESGQSQTPASRVLDRFLSFNTELELTKPARSEDSGCNWYGWTPGEAVRVYQQHWNLQQDNGRLWFPGTKPGAYAFAVFDTPLAHLEEGACVLKYFSDKMNWQAEILERPNMFHRSAGLLIRTDANEWFVSGSLDFQEMSATRRIELASLEWRRVRNVQENGLLAGVLEPYELVEDPVFDTVTAAGIVMHDVPSSSVDFWISKIEWIGRAAPAAMLPLNGPKHRILGGLGQEDLSFWRNGSSTSILPVPESGNVRTILAGNKDGFGATLYEQAVGKGVILVTSLKLLQEDEPAASVLRKNAFEYLQGYEAEAVDAAPVCCGSEFGEFLSELGLVESSVAILDADDAESMASLDDLGAFVNGGGTLMVQGGDAEAVEELSVALGLDLRLTEPYLGERQHCVKAPVSWTHSDSPADLVEYYDGVLCHQPFEPNYDPLLAGIANHDLDWDGAELFDFGIELHGMDPVRASDGYAILMSNWRIDWSQPYWGGEYIHAGKDQRRAEWFVNRDPVLLRVRAGQGSVVLCRLNYRVGSEKVKRVYRQLLTNLGCALGAATVFPPLERIFDLAPREAQLTRFEKYYEFLKPAVRKYYGTPDHMCEERESTVMKKAGLMLIGDDVMRRYEPYVLQEMWETHSLQRFGERPETTGDALACVDKVPASPAILQISVGLEDLRLDEDGRPQTSVETFAANLEAIIRHLRENRKHAKLYWTSILPVPEACGQYARELVPDYNAAAQQVMDANDVYTNDLYRFVRDNMPGYMAGDRMEFSKTELAMLGKQVAKALTFFGAQE